MRKLLLFMMLLVVPNVLGSYDLFTTKINITTFSNDTMVILGEEGYTRVINTSLNQWFNDTLFIYRDAPYMPHLYNLTLMESNTSKICLDSYNLLLGMNSSVGTGYYDKYVSCFFSLNDINSSLVSCVSARDTLQNQSNTCSTSLSDCSTNRDTYSSQYSACSTALDTCVKERDSYKWNWLIGAIIGVIAGLIIMFFYQKKKLPSSGTRHPMDNTEEMELG